MSRAIVFLGWFAVQIAGIAFAWGLIERGWFFWPVVIVLICVSNGFEMKTTREVPQ